jgi:hypothetical protein
MPIKHRPPNFSLNRHHYLSRGLVFAGLGNSSVDTIKYRDSSVYGNHGTLTGMVPSEDWVWSQELGRWVLDFDTTDDWVSCGVVNFTARTAAAWIRTSENGDILAFGQQALNSKWDWTVSSDVLKVDSYGSSQSGTVSVRTGNLVHVASSHSGVPSTPITFYVNGIPEVLGNISGTTISGNLQIGKALGSAVYSAKQMADVVLYKRVLLLPEIQILANRSDPMLGGLIQNPRRRFFPIKSSIISTTPIRRYYIVRGVGVQCVY